MSILKITGVGVISPIGCGNEQFLDAVRDGKSGLTDLTGFSLPNKITGGRVRDFNFNAYVRDNRFRRAADISKYALAAGKLASEEAGGVSEHDALIMCITHGALNYSEAFHNSLLTEGAEAVSPLFFSDSVLNSPAGNASICFNVKAPVHTLIGGNETPVKAVLLASEMIEGNRTGRAIIASAEELNTFTLHCYSGPGYAPLAEGSGAIVIEKGGREDAGYCAISAAGSRFYPGDPGEALSDALRICLNKARITIEDIALILADTDACAYLDLNGISAGNIVSMTGNAFSTTTMWHIVLGCLCIKEGQVPETIIQDRKPAPGSVKNIMICAVEKTGAASVIILSK